MFSQPWIWRTIDQWNIMFCCWQVVGNIFPKTARNTYLAFEWCLLPIWWLYATCHFFLNWSTHLGYGFYNLCGQHSMLTSQKWLVDTLYVQNVPFTINDQWPFLRNDWPIFAPCPPTMQPTKRISAFFIFFPFCVPRNDCSALGTETRTAPDPNTKSSPQTFRFGTQSPKRSKNVQRWCLQQLPYS